MCDTVHNWQNRTHGKAAARTARQGSGPLVNNEYTKSEIVVVIPTRLPSSNPSTLAKTSKRGT
jgi:hypothetical protein